ncbi:hypothetical protein PsorP6_012441 [Peronosclerospora sorghi]|uniref:Uncharacterized protein n=1 Tax=Peronosclerospora sorghi TaxID=230839 RepID=A0ACC0WGG6_9STRA|nr:hypothetical protein PsorP6_012441 [Peronosclerospora sorghi]
MAACCEWAAANCSAFTACGAGSVAVALGTGLECAAATAGPAVADETPALTLASRHHQVVAPPHSSS